MKALQKVALSIIALTILTSFAFLANKTVRIKVFGSDNYCKDRIEKSVSVKGVKMAEWNEQTKIITIVFNPDKITEEKLHQLICTTGHKTHLKSPSIEQSKLLSKCCNGKSKIDNCTDKNCKDKSCKPTKECKDKSCKDKSCKTDKKSCKDSKCSDKKCTDKKCEEKKETKKCKDKGCCEKK